VGASPVEAAEGLVAWALASPMAVEGLAERDFVMKVVDRKIGWMMD
jgi:hypothetical protein